MQFYHWIVLILVVLLVIAVFSRVAGALGRTAVTILAIVLFAGFVWGTIPEESKEKVSEVFETIKTGTTDFLNEVFRFGKELPKKEEEALSEMYK